jgi:hypothetical protein
MPYLVLNPKALEADIEAIRNHIEHNGPVIFSEVTNRKVTDEFTNYYAAYFIDPQHTFTGRGGKTEQLATPNDFSSPYSAIKCALINKDIISKFIDKCIDVEKYETPKVLYVLEKPDMDSLGVIVLCEWVVKHGITQLNHNINKRILDIHHVDCWVQPTEWNPDHIQSYEVKWTNILGAAISDWKVPIETRVSIMEDFLLTGNLPEAYQKSIEAEQQLLQQATVETFSSVTIVTSAARSASGLVYKNAPFGIAYCENFMGKGAKYTFMEFTAGKYLDLTGFFAYMNEHYPSEYGTFGGNVKAGIEDSYIPCELSKETVATELAKFVL